MNNPWNDKRVLITGGSGFIGSYLARNLVSSDAIVNVIDVKPLDSSILGDSISKISLHRLDILGDELRELLRNNLFDYIFHLAGSASVQVSVERPFDDFESNLRGTLNLLEALRTIEGSPRLVFLSSAAVYGNPIKSPISEDDITVPISPYGISKLAAERYLYVYSNIHGLKAISARPFSVYGPGQRKQVVFDIIRKLTEDPSRLELFGSGKEARDFIYVTDLVEAILLLALKGRMKGEVYNVACGRAIRISNIAHELCRIMNANPEISYRGTVRPGVPLSWKASIDRLNSLGYKHCVGIKKGLRKTVEWFRDQ